jgi:hypothetical protein
MFGDGMSLLQEPGVASCTLCETRKQLSYEKRLVKKLPSVEINAEI